MSALFKALKRLSISKKRDQKGDMGGIEADHEGSPHFSTEKPNDESVNSSVEKSPGCGDDKKTNELRNKVLKPALLMDMKPRKASTFTGIWFWFTKEDLSHFE